MRDRCLSDMWHGIERNYEKDPEGIICDRLNFSVFLCEVFHRATVIFTCDKRLWNCKLLFNYYNNLE